MSEVRATTLNGKKLEEEKLKTDRGEISQLFCFVRYNVKIPASTLGPGSSLVYNINQGPCVLRSLQCIYGSNKNHNFFITVSGKLPFFMSVKQKVRVEESDVLTIS